MFIKVLQSYSSCKLIKIINYFNCYAWHDLNLTYATILFKLLWYVKASISPCVCDFSFLLILKSIFKLRNIMCKYIIWNLISLFFCTRIHLARKYHLNEELRHIVIRSDEFERTAYFCFIIIIVAERRRGTCILFTSFMLPLIIIHRYKRQCSMSESYIRYTPKTS